LDDPHSYPMTAESAAFARHDVNRFEGLIEPSLLDDMRIVTSELVTLMIAQSADEHGSLVVTTSLAFNVLRIEVDQVRASGTAPEHATILPGEPLIRGISDRCSDLKRIPFQTWVEIDVRTNGVVTRLQPPV
jgi:hypothetical protein